MIERLGFVQLDSINVIERAHHLTLRSRMESYRPEDLRRLLRERRIFEHWTHDASLIPSRWLPYWRYRATLYPARAQRQTWWRERLGSDPETLMRRVLDHVRQNGPLSSRDFESAQRSGTWWGWKPEKTALEHLWRSGLLAISERRGFVKVYDLLERVYPETLEQPIATPEEYHDWAYHQALRRLGVATPAELAEFWGGLSKEASQSWCRQACLDGRAVEVRLEGAPDGVATPDWAEQAEQSIKPGVRILNPFDPVVRDRKRLKRMFAFDYGFEAYVPAPKRVYGYFVLPILQGDRFIARMDAKFHRPEGRLEVKGLWWEAGVRVTAARQQAVDGANQRLEWLRRTS